MAHSPKPGILCSADILPSLWRGFSACSSMRMPVSFKRSHFFPISLTCLLKALWVFLSDLSSRIAPAEPSRFLNRPHPRSPISPFFFFQPLCFFSQQRKSQIVLAYSTWFFHSAFSPLCPMSAAASYQGKVLQVLYNESLQRTWLRQRYSRPL